MVDLNKVSVCLNHPEVAATGRCCVCRKPICDACTIMYKGQKFCSQECKADSIRTAQKVANMEAGKSRASGRRLRRLIFWLLVLAAAGAVVYLRFMS